jgi:peptidoglycan/xylan/chitin deacetylase (PgdA/CDA1 family)
MSQQAPPRFLPILMFHALDEGREPPAFSAERFARGMAELSARGYRTMRLADVPRWLRGEKSLPPRCFVITFDDGYRSVYDAAFSTLRRYDFSATIFATVGASVSASKGARPPEMLNRQMMSFAELRAMLAAGFEVGAHTLSHPDLLRLSDDRIEHEVRRGKEILESELGCAVTSFAYPFGRYDARVRAIVSRHHAIACSDRLGLVDRDCDVLALPRVDAYYLREGYRLPWLSRPWFPWYVRARGIPRELRRRARALLD